MNKDALNSPAQFFPNPQFSQPNPLTEIAKRLNGQDEVMKEFFSSLRQLMARSQAQEAAIRALISVTPDPGAALETHWHQMDLMADHIGAANIGQFREEAQVLADIFLTEVNRRKAL